MAEAESAGYQGIDDDDATTRVPSDGTDAAVDDATPLADRIVAGAIGLIAVLWLVGAGLVALPAPFIIDGYIFEAMSDAFARSGSLFLDNGVGDYGNPSLAILLTDIVDGELVPQYPGFWGVVSGPFYAVFGPRGPMLLNALASIVSMAVTWRLGRVLFADEGLARTAALFFGLATFAVDYAFGLWPQAFGAMFVSLGLLAAIEATQGTAKREPLLAAVAGLVLGLGLTVRVDMLFFLPPVWIWLLAAGRRPYPSLALYLIGLLPGATLASAINYLKFGTFVPVTYGHDSGYTDIAAWMPLLYLAGAAAVASLALGLAPVRATLLRPGVLIVAAAGGLLLALALPMTRPATTDMIAGFWTLVVDFQAVPENFHGARLEDDGVITMFGVVKKALLHSMPYLAACIVLLPRLWRGPDQRAIAFCLLVAAFCIGPYALKTWHGGAANQQRYFLSILPVLVLLAAAAWREIAPLRREGDRTGTFVFLAIAIVAVFVPFLMDMRPGFITQNRLPWALVIALVLLGTAVILPPALPQRFGLAAWETIRAKAGQALRTTFIVAVATAAVSGWMLDIGISQFERRLNMAVAAEAEKLPSDAVIVTFVAHRLGMRLNRPGVLTIQGDDKELTLDEHAVAMIRIAEAEGRPIIAHSLWAIEELERHGMLSAAEPLTTLGPRDDLYRVELVPES
ncbi:MAG: hypothetical protein AAF844_17680 [Pseudomonadota bacterium]